MHIVKCPVCEKNFDRDKIPNHKDGRRYLHIECWLHRENHKTQDEKDKEDLEQYIAKLFGVETVSQKIKRQIVGYHDEYAYTYTGMKKALIYHYEIKNGDIKQSNGGVGIIPYVYDQARNYYYQIWLAQQKNKDKNLNDYIPTTVSIKIINPQRKPKKRQLFNFLDEEGDEQFGY